MKGGAGATRDVCEERLQATLTAGDFTESNLSVQQRPLVVSGLSGFVLVVTVGFVSALHQKAGITFRMDTCSPSLVNLSADPQLSETLFYVIKEGTTTVGKSGPTSSPDIRLSGVLVAEDHW